MDDLPGPHCPRYASLDFWRGVACLVVILHHATFYIVDRDFDARMKASGPANVAEALGWSTSRMWLGVPIFFVISGYCIAASADSHRRHGHPAGRYFFRRFKRIYPPLFAFVLLGGAFITVLDRTNPGLAAMMASASHPVRSIWDMTYWQWIGNLTLTESWRFQAFGDGARLSFGHLWTLCYEEQFYFVVGLILLWSPRRLFFGLAAVTIACATVARILWWQKIGFSGLFFDDCWLQFAAGLGVYYVVNYASQGGRLAITGALLAALLLQFRRPGVLADFIPHESQRNLVAFAFALFLLVLHRFDERICQSSVLRPVTWCGTMCYSIYLVHYPITAALSAAMNGAGYTGLNETLWLTCPLCLAGSVAAGYTFHICLERRFLNSAATVKPEVVEIYEAFQPTIDAGTRPRTA